MSNTPLKPVKPFPIAVPRHFSSEMLKELIRPYYLKWLYFPLRGLPPYFRQSWGCPELDPRGLEAGDGDVVILPMSDWHARLQRPHHMALELARQGRRCFYLSPHLGREFPRVYPFSERECMRSIAPGIAELHVHLWREPVYHHRRLHEEEEDQVASALTRMLESAGLENPLVLTSLPVWNGVGRRLKERFGGKLVYDCHDLIEGFDNIASDLLDAERDLFEASDLVLFTAEWLMEHHLRRLPDLRDRSLIVRNAVDPDHFAAVPLNPPASPTVGYMGSLDTWFDTEAISFAARQHPQWIFQLIGREESPHIQPLREIPNVRFVGEISYRDLPSRLSAVSVAVIPFRIRPLTLATNPLKLYEYLCAGLPVVSSALPEVCRYENLVGIYRSPEEFSSLLERAVREDTPALRVERRRAMQNETWSVRCRQLLQQTGALQPQV